MELAARTLLLLTREARERRGGLELIYWGTSPEGPVRVRLTDQRAVLFVPRDVETRAGERAPVDRATLDGRPVDRVAFVSRRELRAEADRLARLGTPALESDVKPADRALFERFVTGACTVRGPARERRGYLDFVDPTIEPAEATPSLRVASFDAAWIRELTDDLYAGRLDEQLVYRKRLRRELDSYVKNVPPLIAAARQLEKVGREIAYVITVRGPQPVVARTAPIDYAHYLERQLAPAADTVLGFVGDDFMRLGGRQLSLF